jgi:Divergent InlB B-repeat domain
MKAKHFFVVLLGLWAVLSTQSAHALTAPAPHISTASGQYTTNQITVEGTARANSGITSIQYLFNGSGPYSATQPNTNNWNKWQATVSLNAGTNIFQVWAVGTNGLSPTNSAHYFLIVKSPITVSVVGSGKVVPNYNGKQLIIDHSFSMVAVPGSGQVFAGWSGTVTSNHALLNFEMQSGENLTATFEPSPFTNGLTGIYDGLFYDTNSPSETSSGYLTLTLGGDHGVFSGSIMLDGQTKSFAGQFAGDGSAQLTIKRPANGNLSLSLSLDLSGVNGLTGSIVCASTNSTNAFDAPLQAYRLISENSNYMGYYTWAMNGSLFDGGTGPEGYSYGTATIPPKGNAALSLYLSDGVSTIAKSGLTEGGLLPLYLSLNGSHGSLSGWLKFATNGLTVNTMEWFKKPVMSGFYTNGFTLTNLPLVLSPYLKGTNTLGSSNVVVQLSGGDLTSALIDFVTLGAGTNFSVTDTNHIAVSLDLKTGIFTGTFIDPADGQSAPLHGALVQPSLEAFGFFMPTNHLSGGATITAAP